MADRQIDFLLIGGGLAAASCARSLREAGAEGSVTIVGREPHPPYNRPPCSKGYMTGKETVDDCLFEPYDFWGEQDIELLTGTSAIKLDATQRTVKLSNREVVGFDKALLATGANVRRLPVDGGRLEGIHYLRVLGNSDAIVTDAKQAEHVVIIGGSYIGTEVAASLTTLGHRCSIVMQESVTHERGFGTQAGGFFQRVLEEHGVTVHGGDELERFEGEGDRVQKVITKNGLELDADMVVIGAGVAPDVMLAKPAGLELGERGGVRCSAQLETSVPGIYAAGDLCEYDSVVHGRPIRVEHWDVALNHGKTAALNMLGQATPHDVVPYFFSDLADWAAMEYVGPANQWDEEIVRGSPEDGEFSVFYVQEGRVAGALSVGRSDDLDHARRLMTEKSDVSDRLGALAEVDCDLGGL